METTSVNDDNLEDFLGRKVRKHFEGHGYFVGEVMSYNPNRKFFRVMYEDGDKEEVDPWELQEILWDSAKSKGTTAAKERRGGRRGKAGRKIPVESGRAQNREIMSEEEVEVQIEHPLRTKNLETLDLNRTSEQHYQPPFLPGTPSLQDSQLGTMEESSIGGQTTRKNFKNMVGQNVRKFFKGHGYFLGTVVAYHSRRRFFMVEYIDGDFEELDWSELMEILVNNNETSDEADFRKDMEGEEELKKSQSLTKALRGTKADEVGDKPEGKLEARQNHEAKQSVPKSLGSPETPAAGVRELVSQEKMKVARGIHSNRSSEGTPANMVVGRFRRHYYERELGLRTKLSGGRKNGTAEDCPLSLHEKERAEEANQTTLSPAESSESIATGGVCKNELLEDVSSDRSEHPRNQSPGQTVLENTWPMRQKVLTNLNPIEFSTSSKQDLSTTSKPSQRRKFVGRTVRKHFDGFGEFTGKVVSYDAHTKYFKVEYTDGDREEVDLLELREIIDAQEFVDRNVRKRKVLVTSKRK